MSKVKNAMSIAQLKNINLNPCDNYIGAFGTEKQSGIKIDRLRVVNAQLIEHLKNLDNKTIQDFIKSQHVAVDDANKAQIIKAHTDFFDANPLLVTYLKDNNKQLQPAIMLWHEKTTAADGRIVSNDQKYGYNRYILVNRNLDKSYGTQAENPRIKISSGINTLLNCQLFKSCARFGELLDKNILYINDIIDAIATDAQLDNLASVASFQGAPIINRGYYDAPDVFGKDKTVGAAGATDATAASNKATDIYM